MTRYIYEVDIAPSDGGFTASSFDIDCSARGSTPDEALDEIGRLLRNAIRSALSSGARVPNPSSGNRPTDGGSIGLVNIDVAAASIDAVTAAEAAEILGITRARVSQLLSTGKLKGWRFGNASLVSSESIAERQKTPHGPGRPKKQAAADQPGGSSSGAR